MNKPFILCEPGELHFAQYKSKKIRKKARQIQSAFEASQLEQKLEFLKPYIEQKSNNHLDTLLYLLELAESDEKKWPKDQLFQAAL